MAKEIVVVGSINLDLVANVSRLPLEGETLLGHDFAMYPGGKGANQAVIAARLGGEVAMVGRLGNDLFAQQLRRELDDAGVNTECVRNVDKPSGSAIVLVTAGGGNSIVVVPGANHSLLPEHLEEHSVLFREAKVVLSQLEIPLETVEHLGRMAASYGIPFLLDPAPMRALPASLLRNVTWLTPNENETQSILESLGPAAPAAATSAESIAASAERILATGVRNLILKLGERGVYLAGKDVAPCYVAPYRVTAIDTTAAGDAFNGGFAYALTRKMPPVEAARFACAVAALSVTRVGAQPSMPALSEVEELIRTTTVMAGPLAS